jgi:hypothetical protein
MDRERARSDDLFEPGAGTSSGGGLMGRWAAWQCPECGHEEQQLAVAVMVGHRCRHVRRVVAFVRRSDPVSRGPAGSSTQAMAEAERRESDPKDRRPDV